MEGLMKRFSTVTVLCLSLVFLFAVGTAGAATKVTQLAMPHPLTPGNLALLTNLPRTTTLAWFPVAEAISYTVTLEYSQSEHGTYAPVSGFPMTGLTTFSLQLSETELAATGDGWYEWTVQAIGDGTNTKNSSPTSVAFLKFIDIMRPAAFRCSSS